MSEPAVAVRPAGIEPVPLVRPEHAPTAAEPAPVPALGDLGTPEQVYPGSGWRRLTAWLVALVCCGLTAAVGYGVLHQPHKDPKAGIGLMVLFGGGGFAALYVALSLGELSYLVFPAALVQRRGSAAKVIPWEHIREVNRTMHPGWTVYRVAARGGIDLRLTADIKNHVALGSKVEQRVIDHLLPAVLEQLDRGETVRFGPLGVNRDGLYVENDFSPWPQTTLSIGLSMDRLHNPTDAKLLHLHVYTQVRTKAFKVEVGKVPNVGLLLELAGRHAPQCLPPDLATPRAV